MRSVRRISALALLVLGVSAVTAGGSPASAQPQTQTRPSTTPTVAAKPRTVTLLTGDTVHVSTKDGETTVDVVPGKGRERIPFIKHSAGQDVEVIPADAVGLLNRGKLDERLFNISMLVGFGYDDTRATLPLIVQHGSAAPAASPAPGPPGSSPERAPSRRAARTRCRSGTPSRPPRVAPSGNCGPGSTRSGSTGCATPPSTSASP
ncbi:hypothetical protein [Dactylosporangium darangshiense]|uniref:hypothetical protein n=1 Tax=Dactylosporangium darangshiense TaxID=579108 RepID=UPI0036311149